MSLFKHPKGWILALSYLVDRVSKEDAGNSGRYTKLAGASLYFDKGSYEFTYQTAFCSHGSLAGKGDSNREKLAV